jgi:hypothetical protein
VTPSLVFSCIHYSCTPRFVILTWHSVLSAKPQKPLNAILSPSSVNQTPIVERSTAPPVLSAISYGHVRDWIAIRIKHNTFDLLSNLWRVDDNEFSNCHCKQKRDG